VHRNLLLSFSEDVDVSRNVFVTKLSEHIVRTKSILTYEVSARPFITLASIDVNVQGVHSILLSMKSDLRFSNFFTIIMDGEAIIDNLLKGDSNASKQKSAKFVNRTHVTLAHYKQMSQDCLKEVFDPLNGTEVDFSVVGLLWSNNIAALAVRIPSVTKIGSNLPPCRNNFPHITIWHQHNTATAESNNLPSLVLTGEAYQIDFDEPISLDGIISLWDDSK
jgi:Fungal tRNA ligase phosphodiesterase domain